MKNIKFIKNQQGIASLILVIIITATAFTLAITGLLGSIDENQNKFHQENALETFAGADGCVEKALLELNSDRDNYNGENYTLENIDCVISISGTGTTRTITATANKNNQYFQEIEVDVDWTTDFEITNWENKNT